MAKQPYQLPRELKLLEAKEVDPSLLYIRELRGRNVNEESNPPLIKHPTDPNCEQSITNSPTTTDNSLPPPFCQSTPEVNSPTSGQFSSELDTDQGDMIDKTIKQVMHKLHQTILTLDIDNFNPDRATCALPNKPMTMSSININPRQARATTLQFSKTPRLQLASSDKGNHIACNKINRPPHLYLHHLSKLNR